MAAGPPRQIRPLAGAFLTAAVWACVYAPDENGPRIVENTLASSWESTGEWTLDEDLRLYGPPGGYFGAVGGLGADSRDYIFVLDGLAQEIHVFDSEGSFVRTLGGSGEGPGEFQMASGLAFQPGDTLWVVDPMSGRYSMFGPNGDFLRVRIRRVNGGGSSEVCSTPDGSYLDWVTRFPNEERSGNLADVDLLHVYPVRVSPHGGLEDTLPRLEFTQEMAEMPSLGIRRPIWFGATLATAFDCRASIWFAHTGEYRLFKRSLDGDTTIVASLDATPAAVDEADRDEIRAFFASRPDMAADYVSTLPDRKPIIDKMFVDGEGHLFVIPEAAGVEAGAAIDVFREDGVFVGRLAVPKTVSLSYERAAYATSDYLLFPGEDDAGTPYVTRLRIRR